MYCWQHIRVGLAKISCYTSRNDQRFISWKIKTFLIDLAPLYADPFSAVPSLDFVEFC